jgi:hypothetical protein
VYLATATALGAPQAGRVIGAFLPPRGLPPHVDAATRTALAAFHGARLDRVDHADGRVVVHTDRGQLTITAAADELRAGGAAAGSQPGDLALVGVLDLSRRPPPLRGLQLTSGGRSWAFLARDGTIHAEALAGPEVPVA